MKLTLTNLGAANKANGFALHSNILRRLCPFDGCVQPLSGQNSVYNLKYIFFKGWIFFLENFKVYHCSICTAIITDGQWRIEIQDPCLNGTGEAKGLIWHPPSLFEVSRNYLGRKHLSDQQHDKTTSSNCCGCLESYGDILAHCSLLLSSLQCIRHQCETNKIQVADANHLQKGFTPSLLRQKNQSQSPASSWSQLSHLQLCNMEASHQHCLITIPEDEPQHASVSWQEIWKTDWTSVLIR